MAETRGPGGIGSNTGQYRANTGRGEGQLWIAGGGIGVLAYCLIVG